MHEPGRSADDEPGRGSAARRGVLVTALILLAAAGVLVAWQVLTPSGVERQERRWQELERTRRDRRLRLARERAEQAAHDRHLARLELSEDAGLAPPKRGGRRPRAHRRGRTSAPGVAITMYMTPS